MDLSTTYLGLELAHPLMPGASPLVDDLDVVRRLEDAGAAAIVMHSLFEEQITRDALGALEHVEGHAESHAEAASYTPPAIDFALGPDEYLEQVRRIKEAVAVPVIGSLNGVTVGGWLEHARLIEEAGADALELNTYHLATDPAETGASVEQAALTLVSVVREHVSLPLAVKLSPYYSALAHLAGELGDAGADGLVLFNRFYQPDIDIEQLSVTRQLTLSSSSELPLRLRWLAVLSSRAVCSLAASGGVHEPVDALKAVMAGAHAVQVVSALLRHGPGHLTHLRDGLVRLLEENEYESLRQARGSMDLSRCPDPKAYERANYIQLLQGWQP